MISYLFFKNQIRKNIKTLFTWSGGTPVQWGKFLLFCVRQSVKTKEIYSTGPGSLTPCKQALTKDFFFVLYNEVTVA